MRQERLDDFQTLSRDRDLSRQVHRILRNAILEGAYPPGTELKQSELAKRFQISRGPVREAFHSLEEEGLLQSAVNLRATVTDLNPLDIAPIYGARIALETYAIRLTAAQPPEHLADEAQAALDLMAQTTKDGDRRGWTDAHFCFHSALTSGVGGIVSQTLDRYRWRCDRFVVYYHQTRPGARAVRLQEHIDLLDAVSAGERDKSAVLLARHLGLTASELLHDVGRECDQPIIDQASTAFALSEFS